MQRWGQGLPRLELSHGAPQCFGSCCRRKEGRPVCPSRNMPLLVKLSGSSGRQLCLLLFRWERMTDKGTHRPCKGAQLKSVSWHYQVGRGRSLKLERRESEPFLGTPSRELRKPLGGKCSSIYGFCAVLQFCLLYQTSGASWYKAGATSGGIKQCGVEAGVSTAGQPGGRQP